MNYKNNIELELRMENKNETKILEVSKMENIRLDFTYKDGCLAHSNGRSMWGSCSDSYSLF